MSLDTLESLHVSWFIFEIIDADNFWWLSSVLNLGHFANPDFLMFSLMQYREVNSHP